MSDEPKKPLSAELRAIRDEYNDIAKRIKDATSRLDRAIWEVEAKERRAELDKTLDEFVPHNYGALKGHDVSFLINKSKDMGDGYNSRIGAAVDAAFKVHVAVGCHDTKVGIALWDTSTSHLRIDADRLDKAREKTANNAKDLLPVVKDIMISNTPDKQGDRQKHYVIISDGNVTDNPDFSVQMIETAMKMNPRVTFDFISFGPGSINDLAAKVNAPTDAQKPGIYTVEKPEDLNATVMSVLAQRFAAPAPAPKPEPVKVAQPASPAP